MIEVYRVQSANIFNETHLKSSRRAQYFYSIESLHLNSEVCDVTDRVTELSLF